MANYFLDTEFHEYKKKPLIGKPIDTIELISIGIVDEDGREYYAISNEFDVKAAWSNKWLRDNVLLAVYVEIVPKGDERNYWSFTKSDLKMLLKLYGKSNKEIAKEIKEFVYNGHETVGEITWIGDELLHKFYAYYADYDWVVFCWLFGRMIDLPDGFPMYCNDLKQLLDEKLTREEDGVILRHYKGDPSVVCELREYKTLEARLNWCKNFSRTSRFPKQENEHNALDDAKWNLRLFNWINKL